MLLHMGFKSCLRTLPKPYYVPRLNGSISRSSRLASFMPRPKASGYPERILIYHSGVGKIVFLGCLKITTLFLFAFSTIVVAPRFYLAPEEPNWTVTAVLAGGIIPFLFVWYTTIPFVCYVHIRLPVFARQSHEQLMRWSKSIPANTEVDLTTMRMYGKMRVTRVALYELQEKKRTILDVSNLIRVRPSNVEKRPWWTGRAMTRFYVSNEQQKSRQPGIWPRVLEAIRNSGQSKRATIQKG